MGLTLIQAPEDEPVTLQEVKEHLRRTDTHEDDSYIQSLITAAREMIEEQTGRAFHSQLWALVLREFPCSGIVYLGKSPLIEVVSVTYRDAIGDYQTMSEGVDYYVGTEHEPGTVEVGAASWPVTGCHPDAVTIAFRAGYTDREDSPAIVDRPVPARIKYAIMGLVAHWFENREAVQAGASKPLPMHVERLITGLRVWNA